MLRELELASAPEELLGWVSDAGNDDDAWDGADEAAWLIWMACCVGIPVPDVVVATSRSVWFVAKRFGDDVRKPVRRIVKAIRNEVDSDVLSRAIRRCERLAGPRDTYRTATPRREIHIARAAVLLGQSSEALAAGAAVDEAERWREGANRGATLGIPPIAMTPAATELIFLPARIEIDAVQQELAYVTAATAHAATQTALALAHDDDRETVEAAECRIADHLHKLLSPLRALLEAS